MEHGITWNYQIHTDKRNYLRLSVFICGFNELDLRRLKNEKNRKEIRLQKTLVIIKPDGVRRGLIGQVISRFEKKGMKIIELKMLQLSREKAEELYSPHVGKDFYEPLLSFITSGPIVVMVLEAENAIPIVRKIIGATSPLEAIPGTIRGDYSLDVQQNLVHASDSEENAKREIAIFF